MAYAIPQLRQRAPYNQWLSMASFWIMCTAMMTMTFALTFAGVIQVHLQRVLGQSYHGGAGSARVLLLGPAGLRIAFVVAALMFVWAVLVPGRERPATAPGLLATGRISDRAAAHSISPAANSIAGESNMKAALHAVGSAEPGFRPMFRAATSARCSNTPGGIACRCC